MEESNHWLSKIIIGKGTLKDFKKEYDMINVGDNQFATASQLFPQNLKLGNLEAPNVTDQGEMIYEYIIYYKVNPAALKSLDKETGKVIVDMTEEEGKAMDKDVKEDIKVVI